MDRGAIFPIVSFGSSPTAAIRKPYLFIKVQFHAFVVGYYHVVFTTNTPNTSRKNKGNKQATSI